MTYLILPLLFTFIIHSYSIHPLLSTYLSIHIPSIHCCLPIYPFVFHPSIVVYLSIHSYSIHPLLFTCHLSFIQIRYEKELTGISRLEGELPNILRKHKEEVRILRNQIRRTQHNNTDLQRRHNEMRYIPPVINKVTSSFFVSVLNYGKLMNRIRNSTQW